MSVLSHYNIIIACVELSSAMKEAVPNVFEQKMALSKIRLEDGKKKIVTRVSISLSKVRQHRYVFVVKGKNKYCR